MFKLKFIEDDSIELKTDRNKFDDLIVYDTEIYHKNIIKKVLVDGVYKNRHFIIFTNGDFPVSMVEFHDEFEEHSKEWKECPSDYQLDNIGKWKDDKTNRYVYRDYGHFECWSGYFEGQEFEDEDMNEGCKKRTLDELLTNITTVIDYLLSFNK